MKSLLKEFVNQTDLKKSDGSDAGKTDVSGKAGADDVQFSLMRNTINSDGKVKGSDVADYLEKAHDLNDEVDTVLYGLETSDGDVVKVYVNATQAEAFEAEMKKMLGMEDDIEEVINDLATKFDIVDVVWPKNAQVNEPNGDLAQAPDDEALDMGPDAEGDDDEDDSDMEVIAQAEDDTATNSSGEDEAAAGADDKEGDGKKKPKAKGDDEEVAADDEEGEKKPKAKGDKHVKLKSLGKKWMKEDLNEGGKVGKKWKISLKSDGMIGSDKAEHELMKLLQQIGRVSDMKANADETGFTVVLTSSMPLAETDILDTLADANVDYSVNAQLVEAKMQAGCYVMCDDKTVAGPMDAAAAKKMCDEKGGAAKGYCVKTVSDEDAQEANEAQGDTMTIGNKFLQRYLGEAAQAEDLNEAKRDEDGFRDNLDIPGLKRTSPLLTAQLPLAVLATQLYILLGVSIDTLERKVRAVKEGADAFGEKMRTNPTLARRAKALHKALGEAKGFARKMEESKQLDEAGMVDDQMRLQGSKMLAQLEAMLLAMGCPPAVVKIAIRQNREAMTDTAVMLARGALRTRFNMLAAELGVNLSDVAAGKMSGADVEPEGAVAESLNEDDSVEAAVKKLTGKDSKELDADDLRAALVKISKNPEMVEAVMQFAASWRKSKSPAMATEAVDPVGADMYADAVMNLVATLGVPDTAFARQARSILAKEFRTMRGDTNVGALLSLIKRFTAQFAAAKSRATRPGAQTTEPTEGTK